MMDPRVIQKMSDDAAKRAAREKMLPYVPWDEDEVRGWQCEFPFPFLGSYEPLGWTKVEELFCDSSGLGSESEPALTVRALKERILEYLAKPETYGFGVTSAGQFQVYLGVFRKEEVG